MHILKCMQATPTNSTIQTKKCSNENIYKPYIRHLLKYLVALYTSCAEMKPVHYLTVKHC